MLLSDSDTFKFSVSGIRGIFGKDLHPQNITGFIKAFHYTLSKGRICIARDTRSTGNAISQIVLGTLLSLGREVIDLGILPTPTLKAYINHKNMAGGIMISASHNPAQYNAFKFIKKGGFFFSEEDNANWLKYLDDPSHGWGDHKFQGKYSYIHEEAIQFHIRNILHYIPLPDKDSKIKVAVDTLGSTATEVIHRFLDVIGLEYVSIYPHLISEFPRPPEPTEKALRNFGDFMRKKQCDIGFAFDPDADRLSVVDEKGNPIGEEFTLPLASMAALKFTKGDIVTNLSSSWLNQWVAEQNSVKLYRSKIGESNVVKKMQETKASFGGEGNGGVIDPRILSFGRDSFCGVAWILSLLQSKKKPLSDIVKEFPTTFMVKKKIETQNISPEVASKKLIECFPDMILNAEDGLHLSEEGGIPWIHIRASNTEPILRVIAEAQDSERLKKLLSPLPV